MISISLVVAISSNRAIGKDNQLLWHLPADLKHFKQLTSGHTILMGRKTFESIGKPLPNRRNIVISRQEALFFSGAEVVSSLEKALELTKDEKEVFIIGGAEIYQLALPIATTIYLTEVEATYEADAFFPVLPDDEWKLLHKAAHSPDEKNNLPYTFCVFQRKSE